MKNRIVWWVWIWVCGYIIAMQFPQFSIPWYVYWIVFVLLGLLLIFSLSGRKIGILLILICLSFCYYQGFEHRNITQIHLGEQSNEQQMEALNGVTVKVKGHITSPVTVDGDHVGFIAALQKVNILENSPDKNQNNGLQVAEDVQISIRLLSQEEQFRTMGWQRGDDIELSGTLQIPSEARNFGGFDYREYLRQQHIHWVLTLKGTDSVIQQASFHWNWTQLLRYNDQFRHFLAAKLDQLFPESQAGYMKSLLIGLRVDLDPQQFQQFSNLGLTHILAISGMQVAVFSGILLWILRKLRLTKETSIWLVIALLPGYVLFTGSSPSVVRAGLMAMIALFAVRQNWLKEGINLLCLVGWLLLIWNPYLLLNVSFQLSFSVTYGLIIGVPWVSKCLPQKSKTFNSTLAVTLVAQLVSFPLTIFYFNKFSLLSWLANIILVPFISFVVTPLGSIALLFSLISLHAGQWIAWFAVSCNTFTFWLTNVMDGWSLFHLIWPTPSLWWIAVYYGLAALIIRSLVRWKAAKEAQREGVYIRIIRGLRFHRMFFICSLLCFVLLLSYGYNPELWNKEGRVEFIDVGQGDAILIRTPNNHFILVDGGGTLLFRKKGEEWKDRKNPYDIGSKLLVPLLKKRGVHQLDYVIATHEDTDHIGGLQAVLEQIPVRKFIFNGTLKPNSKTEQLFQSALKLHIPLISATEPLSLSIDSRTALRFLHPASSEDLKLNEQPLYLESNQNKRSLVFLLEIDHTRFLFTGDMEKASEDEVLRRLDRINPPSIDVLKVAHHGSKTSTTEQWLDYWRPKLAVISVGEHNTYGHPTEEVLTRLSQHQIDIFRTDQQGEVQMIMTEKGLQTRVKLSGE
ncbi:MAG: competence protein ComEC [Bacilli bacterium]|nr:competence protein ComEC [Bacilli bacterium]